MEVIEAALTPNKWSRPQIAIKPVRGIVIHYVENPGTSAMFNRNFFEHRKLGKTGYGSAHFIIDLSGEVVLCIPPNEVAYHCGENRAAGFYYTDLATDRFWPWPNACTLGVEFCHLDRLGHYTEETLESGRHLLASLCELHDLDPAFDIVRHFDITGKPCPKFFVDHLREFETYKLSVKSCMLTEECMAENGG